MESLFGIQNKKDNTFDFLKKWYDAIGKQTALLDADDNILFDYEVAERIRKYLVKNGAEIDNVKISAPYILITGTDYASDIIKILHIPYDSIKNLISSNDQNVYIINCEHLVKTQNAQNHEKFGEIFLEEIQDIGKGAIDDIDPEISSTIAEFIEEAIFNQFAEDDEYFIAIEVENRVIAIALSEYITDAKECISRILGLKPDIFTSEVSGPTSTILLIDCARIFYTEEPLCLI